MEENFVIEKLPATSFLTIKKLKKLGIKTFLDLLNYFPFRYKDYSIISKIGFCQPAEQLTIHGKIIDRKFQITKTGLKIINFLIEDDTGKIEAVFYNQPYLLNLIKLGSTISIAGKVENFGRKIFIHPDEFELGEPKIHTGRIIPVYSEKYGLSSKTIREKIFILIKNLKEYINEFLPEKIIQYNQLLDEVIAYENIHFPQSKIFEKKAKERLSFDELFLIQLSSQLIKKQWEKEIVGNQFEINKYKDQINNFIKKLPFELTNAQKKVWQEIINDLLQKKPMNRLLQGDVGSGKTVIAGLASFVSYLNGYQTLLMAPTEILAQQHYQTLVKLFKNYSIKLGLKTSSYKISNTKEKKINFDQLDIVIGTHALISKKANFSKVGLVIIDEQHRFGVAQREQLKNKGINPHLLTMTATPIPRTVMLTLYGELDLSVIDEMPKGRLPIKTFYIPKNKRQDCYQWIKNQINNLKSQVYIICPLIEESEIETLKSVKAAKKEFETLKKIFSQFKLGLLHGKLKSKEKDQVMENFKNGLIDILVSTSVVEVGVDVPNATIMIIEGAERFGLAQLHQLRGRVGRSDKQSYCFLFTENENKEIIFRLNFFAKTHSGQKLAEEDLRIRGPGEIFGTKQHGEIDLKIANLNDYLLIEKAKKAVDYFINNNNLDEFPALKQRLNQYKINEIGRN